MSRHRSHTYGTRRDKDEGDRPRQIRVTCLATNHKGDRQFLKELIEAGKVTPVIDRTYPLSRTPDVIGYVGEGHARGKVVIAIVDQAPEQGSSHR